MRNKIKGKLFRTIAITALLLLTVNNGVKAQVTIGSNFEPSRVALLDLKTQQANASLADTLNITTTKGGFLLPRVRLVNVNTLQPFVETSDSEWTNTTTKAALMKSATGLLVYNVAKKGDLLSPGIYVWDGTKWAYPAPIKLEVKTQPKPFSFYETGNEVVESLDVEVIGGVPPYSYQWYAVTGNNVHVRVGTRITGHTTGIGNYTKQYTPTQVIKSTGPGSGDTRYASNCGFYRFYCVITDTELQTVETDICEVAVGCGAKNIQGNWLSFMCFNLGSNKDNTISKQRDETSLLIERVETNKHKFQLAEVGLYGSLFQWGRIADGHEKRDFNVNSYDGGNNSTAYSISIPIVSGTACDATRADYLYPNNQVAKGSGWHGKFIMTTSAPHNWNPNWDVNVVATNQLWRNFRLRLNDPCTHYIAGEDVFSEFWYDTSDRAACDDPGTGWRVPTQEEWGALYRGGVTGGVNNMAMANTWIWHPGNATDNLPTFVSSKGYEIQPDAATTTLFLPTSGYRLYSSGTLLDQGTHGHYWSSTTSNAQAHYLHFHAGNINPAAETNRAQGMAIRCIKGE